MYLAFTRAYVCHYFVLMETLFYCRQQQQKNNTKICNKIQPFFSRLYKILDSFDISWLRILDMILQLTYVENEDTAALKYGDCGSFC